MKNSLIEERRQVTYDWHLAQVIKWLKYDNGRELDSVLVYSSVDLRIAIERYFFELLLLLKHNNLTAEEQSRCSSKEGILDLVKETEPVYVKRAKFTNLIAAVTPDFPRVAIVDFRYLINRWHTLSGYCHKQLKPKESFDSENRGFQKKGFRGIKETVDYFMELERSRVFGLIDPKSMPLETKNVYDKYIKDEIDEEKAKGMLKIMEPVLSERLIRSL